MEREPTPAEWAAALRVIAVARVIMEIVYGGKQAFPKAELDDALEAFDALQPPSAK